MLNYETRIHVHDTDAAGIIFFGNQFKKMHEAYEHLLEKMETSFYDVLKEDKFFIPIVHAESDYKAPLRVGDILNIQLKVESIGNSSFSVVYQIFKKDKTLVGTGKTVHVSIDSKTRQKVDLPKDFKAKLEKFQS